LEDFKVTNLLSKKESRMTRLLKWSGVAAALTGAVFGFAASAANAADKLKVAFIYVGPIGDGGWSFQHHTGLEAVKKEFGDKIQTTEVENVSEGPDAERVIDQLAAAGKSWKTYQENLPMSGPDTIDYSDGNFTNNTDFSQINPQLTPPLTTANIVSLYAAKHNPFVYFQSVQQGSNPLASYANMTGFDGMRGLWSDLGSGKVPDFSLIVPNQCNDQHGRGNSTAFCNFDPTSDGTQAGLNPALIILGDQVVQKIVTAIHGSRAWKEGHNAIVVIWDENDYAVQPIINQVVAIVDTNYGAHKLQSGTFYNHFSLLRTIEGGLRLPCLNHACDATTNTMSDLFGERQ